jgi:hypothetical protein
VRMRVCVCVWARMCVCACVWTECATWGLTETTVLSFNYECMRAPIPHAENVQHFQHRGLPMLLSPLILHACACRCATRTLAYKPVPAHNNSACYGWGGVTRRPPLTCNMASRVEGSVVRDPGSHTTDAMTSPTAIARRGEGKRRSRSGAVTSVHLLS